MWVFEWYRILAAQWMTQALLEAEQSRLGAQMNIRCSPKVTSVRAMGTTGVRRLVAVSVSGFHVDGNDPLLQRFVLKPILMRVFKEPYADSARMEKEVKAALSGRWSCLPASRTGQGPAGTGSR